MSISDFLTKVNNLGIGFYEFYSGIYRKIHPKRELVRIREEGDFPQVFIHKYELKVDGGVKNSLALNYESIRKLRHVHKKVDGKTWTGTTVGELLQKSGLKKRMKNIVFHSLDGKSRSRLIGDCRDLVLAYNLDNKPVPKIMGFPLITVEDKPVKWISRLEIR